MSRLAPSQPLGYSAAAQYNPVWNPIKIVTEALVLALLAAGAGLVVIAVLADRLLSDVAGLEGGSGYPGQHSNEVIVNAYLLERMLLNSRKIQAVIL
jgi:hypothetical protein